MNYGISTTIGNLHKDVAWKLNHDTDRANGKPLETRCLGAG